MSALYGFARFQQLQHWMNYSGWFKDENEMEIDSFGQMMPLVLLALPFLALVEQLGGKRNTSLYPLNIQRLTFFSPR